MSKASTFNSVDWLLLAASVLCWPAIEAWQDRPQAGKQVCQSHETGECATQVDYLLYLPQRYTKCQKLPLVVFLHGSGNRGHDLEMVRYVGFPQQVSEGKHFQFILASPQCPPQSRWNPDTIIALTEHVSDILSVDRNCVYLTGYSMGGFGTWQAAAQEPNRFAAIAPLAGGGDTSMAARLVTIPIWAFHGATDDVVPIASSQAMADAVISAGGHAKLAIYPDLGHDICRGTHDYEELCRWLLHQRRKISEETSP